MIDIRAPRGVELSCKGWVQEAALRMLRNNLDPDVAERPQDLVVYGGTGKAARSWEAYEVIVRELQALGGDETLLVQSGKAVGKFRTHEMAPRVLIANSNLAPAAGDVERVSPARGNGPHDVRPDDGRLMDLHRHAGDPAGHVRDVRRRAQGVHEAHGQGRFLGADGRSRRNGRRAAARGDDERHVVSRRGGRPGAHREASRDALRRRARHRSRRGPRSHRRGAQGRQAHQPRAPRQRRRGVPGSSSYAASFPRSSPSRPPRTIP